MLEDLRKLGEPEINITAPHLVPSIGQRPPRAQGNVAVSVKPFDGRTVLGGLRQAGSLKVLFPRVSGKNFQAVLVNTAGGVTGGDTFRTHIVAQSDTNLTLTTQAAERAYRAQPDEVGQIRTDIVVKDGASLAWLPQETILFESCALDRRLRVTMEGASRLLLCEPVVFGRTAMGETLTSAVLQDRIDVIRDGVPLFCDAIRLKGNIADQLARPTIAAGAAAIATVLYVAPDAESHVEPIRDALGPTSGVSLLRSDVLVIRILAQDSFLMRQTLCPVLTRLSGDPLPRPWMI